MTARLGYALSSRRLSTNEWHTHTHISIHARVHTHICTCTLESLPFLSSPSAILAHYYIFLYLHLRLVYFTRFYISAAQMLSIPFLLASRECSNCGKLVANWRALLADYQSMRLSISFARINFSCYTYILLYQNFPQCSSWL